MLSHAGAVQSTCMRARGGYGWHPEVVCGRMVPAPLLRLLPCTCTTLLVSKLSQLDGNKNITYIFCLRCCIIAGHVTTVTWVAQSIFTTEERVRDVHSMYGLVSSTLLSKLINSSRPLAQLHT